MAAGTACKLRLYLPTSTEPYHKDRIATVNRLQLAQALSCRNKTTLVPYVFELQHTKAASNGATEISAPNAVFDGTTTSVPLALVSNDAKDTAAGVGTRTVKIIVINSLGNLEILTYSMAGTTAVAVNDYPQRIMHMYAASWGAENDTAGTLVLQTRGYQELGMTGKTAATASGLTASTTYYFKINLNGGGATEYSITTGTDVTLGAVLALITADMTTHTVACTWQIIDGDIRCTSNASGTSTIALTAGTSGDDLFATLTDCAVEGAVAGAVQLTISAGKNESDGSAIFLPEDYIAFIDKVVANQTTLANAGTTYVQAIFTNFNDGADPEEDTITVMTNAQQTKEYSDPKLYKSDGAGKITFKESYITGVETLAVCITIAVYYEVAY